MKEVKPYDQQTDKKQQIKQMFNTISKEYDNLNRVISLGMDIRWRKKIVCMASEENPKKILDLATGTADLAIALSTINAEKIIGLDISSEMIEVGKKKIENKGLTQKIDLIVGDGEQLPFEDNSFDVITIAFGLRNYQNLTKGLSEIYRVLKHNGRFLVLETSVPRNILVRMGYKLYTSTYLPAMGWIFSKDKKAYSYLSKSASLFPCGADMNAILSQSKFRKTTNHPKSMGVASIYSAYK